MAVPPLTRLLPKPGMTAFSADEKMPNSGMSHRKPSRSLAWPKPFQLSQSPVFAFVIARSPLRMPSSRLVGDERSLMSWCRSASVTRACRLKSDWCGTVLSKYMSAASFPR